MRGAHWLHRLQRVHRQKQGPGPIQPNKMMCLLLIAAPIIGKLLGHNG